MLPQSKLGKINTFALPATSLPGALDLATDGTNAASACNSPSTVRPGYCSWAILVASATLSTLMFPFFVNFF